MLSLLIPNPRLRLVNFSFTIELFVIFIKPSRTYPSRRVGVKAFPPMIIYMHEVSYTCFLQYVPVFLISAGASFQPPHHKQHPLIPVSIPPNNASRKHQLPPSHPANCFAFKATMATCMRIGECYQPNVFIQQIIFRHTVYGITIFSCLPLSAFNFPPKSRARDTRY